MPNGIQRRTRSERVAALELPPGLLDRTLEYLQRGDVVLRLGLCALTAVLLWTVTGAWDPPMPYRTGFTPPRGIVAKIDFRKSDPDATQEAQEQARRKVLYVYENDSYPLVQLRAALQNRLVQVLGAKSLKELDPGVAKELFEPPAGAKPKNPVQPEAQFKAFHDALASQEALAKIERAVGEAMAPLESRGIMESLAQEHTEGNQQEIVVHPKGQPELTKVVAVNDVLIGEIVGTNADNPHSTLENRLLERVESREVATRIYNWLRPRLRNHTTLALNAKETEQAKADAVAKVGEKFITYHRGDLLVPGGVPISGDHIALLDLEHQTYIRQLTRVERAGYSLAALGMFVALSILCGVYVLCYEPKLIGSLRRFSTMLALIVITVGAALLASDNAWRAEVIPLLLFAMTVAIAYHQELALLFSAAVALVIVVATGQGLSQFTILTAAAATAILLVGSIRSRRKLIYVGMCVGVVALMTTIGVGTLEEQPFWQTLWPEAQRFGLWCVVAGFLMTGLLPFIESLFEVQTELSLLELGDVAHPLLQELVRRAPGTYNHSINVASIAEAAAESIGCNGLLVRVGAYFHDIGKMLKPGYFVENQGQDASRHESLVPAMSTLIIIAHIKDGADLARQHHLPQTIIDFILQHHGTTLVEFFFRRAAEQTDPENGELEESAFRYPGPKPQTKEAAVLMVADAVESASRALVEPTPSRIESLVHEIAMKRLVDGQFDACGLTLKELATLEDSLVKSLTAVYHGRVKYPGQRTA